YKTPATLRTSVSALIKFQVNSSPAYSQVSCEPGNIFQNGTTHLPASRTYCCFPYLLYLDYCYPFFYLSIYYYKISQSYQFCDKFFVEHPSPPILRFPSQRSFGMLSFI